MNAATALGMVKTFHERGVPMKMAANTIVETAVLDHLQNPNVLAGLQRTLKAAAERGVDREKLAAAMEPQSLVVHTINTLFAGEDLVSAQFKACLPEE